MADEDETELPLWWVGDRQLRLRLGGSFARVLKRLDAHAVAAMQGTGDMLRRVTRRERRRRRRPSSHS